MDVNFSYDRSIFVIGLLENDEEWGCQVQFSMMTPHQFESVRPYVDTILISTFTPLPLDIAIPYAASELISAHILDAVSSHFRGRVTMLHAGSTSAQRFLNEEWLQSYADAWMHPIQHGVVITDRTLVDDTWRFPTAAGVHWLVFDWWQWLRRRVAKPRRCEAMMYLCHACPPYWDSPERKMLGIEESLAESMKEEGNRLLDALVSALVDEVLQMWSTE